MAARKRRMSLGELVDALHAIDEQIARIEDAGRAKVRALEAQRGELEEQILQGFKKQDLEGAYGKKAVLERAETPVPKVEDFAALVKHVAKTGQYELLQQRVGVTAWRERVAAKKKVPGVETFTKVTLKTKPRKKRGGA